MRYPAALIVAMLTLNACAQGLVSVAYADNVSQVCTERKEETRESYWCWEGFFHWRCYRTVTRTVWDCPYFNQKVSCYAFAERHRACARGDDGNQYSFSWTTGCFGYFSGVCQGSGAKRFNSRPSVSQGCSSNLLDCP
jgi:hypothetical protein